MDFEGNARDNPLNWSFRIGRLFAIEIRIHVFFIIGAVLILVMAFKDSRDSGGLVSVTDQLITVIILFVIVLLHEFGHCWGARSTGGSAEQIMLWPLGGLASVSPPHTPRAHAITTAAGPAVNVVICIMTGVWIAVVYGGIGALPLNPIRYAVPLDVSLAWASRTHYWLCIVFGISYLLFLFNLLPIYPLDGGRMLHATLWPRQGYRNATLTATFVGMIGAVALGVAGMILESTIMIMIAFFGYFTCYSDRRMAKTIEDEIGEFGYDFSQGYTSMERAAQRHEKKPGYFERRRRQREEARQQREEQDRISHQQQVDVILAKVHERGLTSLSAKERRILEEETKRQRSAGG